VARDEEAYGHFLIKPDPGCQECTEIMVWRSAHRFIAISDGAEIRLSCHPWGSRHLHMRKVQGAQLKGRVVGQPTGQEKKERMASSAVT